ncbi:MAG: DNA polymerase-3 subunit delta' [Planctomycetota bacterium]|jgi:DNA polymerase-3 subunit delta'
MQILDELISHEATLEGLWNAAAEKRLPHAFVFEGASGIGKFNAALRFASGLFCDEGPGAPCGTCPPCKRIRSGERRGNHPDLYLIDAVEEALEATGSKKVLSLSISLSRIAIRDGDEDCAEGFLRLVSVEDGWRIVIIREAERMNKEAQNALLKTLEEPGKHTLLILETSLPGDLLATIQSRCVKIRFDYLPIEQTERLLISKGVDLAEALVLAAWSNGAPGEALRLKREGALEMRALFLSVLQGQRGAVEAAAEFWKLPGEFIGSTPKAQGRHRARVALDVLLGLLGDWLRLTEGLSSDQLRHRDIASQGGFSGGAFDSTTASALKSKIDSCLELRATMQGNVSPEPTIERCLLVLENTEGAAIAPGR